MFDVADLLAETARDAPSCALPSLATVNSATPGGFSLIVPSARVVRSRCGNLLPGRWCGQRFGRAVLDIGGRFLVVPPRTIVTRFRQ
ncbi:hypothetical protein [Jiangella alkaliphila]|uniref:hypothetical protein n=1 Tax=Jiangella alkaliphila TaxID=419479 RepID=UPI00128D1823|nr:hypothetical protein [Jiangella alkaliphila]